MKKNEICKINKFKKVKKGLVRFKKKIEEIFVLKMISINIS